MWRKPADAKPSPLASKTQATAPAATQSFSPAPKIEPAQPPAPTAFSTTPAAPHANPNDSRISAGLKIHGEISGSSDLYIDGETQGKIRFSMAKVTVGPNGRVEADIEAREIVVLGSVRGNLKASERTHLGESSRVQGSLQTPRLGIEEGAKFRGKVDMTRPGEPPIDSALEKRSAKRPEKQADTEALKPVAVEADQE